MSLRPILLGGFVAASLAALAGYAVTPARENGPAGSTALVEASGGDRECRIAFRSPAVSANAELMRPGKGEMTLELVANSSGLGAWLSSTTMAMSVFSRAKLRFESGDAVVDSPLSLAGPTSVKLQNFGFNEASLALARMEFAPEMTVALGSTYHAFDLWEAPAALAVFKSCIREKLRGQPSAGAPAPRRSASAPRPPEPPQDAFQEMPVAPYRAAGVTGDVIKVGDYDYQEACQLILRGTRGGGSAPVGLGIAIDHRGELAIALKGPDGKTPKGGGPWFTDLDGAKISSAFGGLASAGLRMTAGEEAADLFAQFERGKAFNVNMPLAGAFAIDLAPMAEAKTWLADCDRKRFNPAGVWATFLDGVPMRIDAERLGAAWLQATGRREFEVESFYSGRQLARSGADAPMLPREVQLVGRVSALVRIVPDSDVVTETARMLEAGAAACPKGQLPEIVEGSTGGRRTVSALYRCSAKTFEGTIIATGFARGDGSSAVMIFAQSNLPVQGTLKKLQDALLAAIPKLETR